MRDSILQPDDKLSSFKTVITSYEIIMRDRRQLQVGPQMHSFNQPNRHPLGPISTPPSPL